MTPADFAAWVEEMLKTRGWTRQRCSVELDCGINQIARWSRSSAKIPRYIGLACAALVEELEPWKASRH